MGGFAATNATSHGRRSFLVVMAASWRSRQRPSPLRGGHGGGLCPFVVVTAEVFYTSTQKQRKKSLHMRLPPFSSQEPAWGLRLFAALAPPGEFFGEIIEKKKKKAEKATSTGRGRWSCGGLRRAALEVTAVFCGHGRWFILEVFLGFSIWRLKRHNPQFAFVAAVLASGPSPCGPPLSPVPLCSPAVPCGSIKRAGLEDERVGPADDRPAEFQVGPWRPPAAAAGPGDAGCSRDLFAPGPRRRG